jgi:hypothetical protein
MTNINNLINFERKIGDIILNESRTTTNYRKSLQKFLMRYAERQSYAIVFLLLTTEME